MDKRGECTVKYGVTWIACAISYFFQPLVIYTVTVSLCPAAAVKPSGR